MKSKELNIIKYFCTKLNKVYSYKSSFGQMQLDKDIKKIVTLPNSNVIVFPKKYHY